MVVAEPATVAALRERWGGTGSFAQFVSRQARLALDRAERALLGYRYKVPKDVAEAIGDSPEYRADVAALAARLGLTEPETAERARAALDSLVASMSPVAVDLLYRRAAPAARLRVGRPGRHRRARPAAGAEPPPRAGLPAQPPLVRGPAAARRRARRA